MYFLLTLILLLIIAAIILVNVVNPNDYKPQIEKAFNQNTGRVLDISGKISWEFLPHLGFSLGTVSIQNPSGYPADKNFASIKSVSISLEPWPLIHKQVLIDNINLDGLVLNLIQHSSADSSADSSSNNWTFETPNKTKPQTSEIHVNAKTPEASNDSASAAMPLFLGINSFKISNAQINFTGALPSQNWNINNVNISAKNLALKQSFSIQISLNFEGQSNLKVLLDLSANIQISENNFKLQNLNAKINDSTLTGHMSVENFAAPHVQAAWMLDHVDLADYANLQGARLLIGATTLNFNLTSAGVSNTQLPASLNGSIHADIASLVLKGADVGKMLSAATQMVQSLVQQQNIAGAFTMLNNSLPAFSKSSGSEKTKQIDPNNGQETDIGHFAYNSVVKNGVISNQDLALVSPSFQIKGAGVIDLNQESINYKLSAFSTPQDPNNLILPIIIQGPFSDVHTGVDIPDLLNQVQKMFRQSMTGDLNQQVTDAVKNNSKKLLNNLKDNLQGFLGN